MKILTIIDKRKFTYVQLILVKKKISEYTNLMTITQDTHTCEMFSIIKDIIDSFILLFGEFVINYQIKYPLLEDDTLDT